MTIKSINPATGETVNTYQEMSTAMLRAKLAKADHTYDIWRTTDLQERAQCVERLADVLEALAHEFAHLMSLEMGKTLSASHAELGKCIQYCRYMAKQASHYLADEIVETEYKKALVRPLPLGVVLLVMPWNYPFWQVLRVAVTAILAGNTCLLKHASNVPECALALETIFDKAGFFEGVFQTLLIGANTVETLIKDECVKAVSLTGSEQAGAAVASLCGKHIKKCVLELGGSDPFIVMPSADVTAAVDAAFTSRMRNNGQSCIAAKRLIIHADIYESFKAAYVKKMNAVNIGDPLRPDTELGPLSSRKALQDVNATLTKATSAGVQITTTSHILPKHGFFIRPSLIENIEENMEIYRQEIFAPIALLFKVSSLQHAITLANDTDFGLSSVLFSNDKAEHDEAIAHLEAGSTYINRYASSDIRLPFGGIKRSGFGREMGKAGMLEFTNLKTVIIAN